MKLCSSCESCKYTGSGKLPFTLVLHSGQVSCDTFSDDSQLGHITGSFAITLKILNKLYCNINKINVNLNKVKHKICFGLNYGIKKTPFLKESLIKLKFVFKVIF